MWNGRPSRLRRNGIRRTPVRYQEDFSGKPPIVGTIYLQKWARGENPPEKLSITIEETK